MSDYLNSLVTRTLRLAPVVQPRPASLFEPVAPGPVSESGFAVSENLVTQERALPSESVVREPSEMPGQEKPHVFEKPAPHTVLQTPALAADMLPSQMTPASVFSTDDRKRTRDVRAQERSSRSAETDSITSASETRHQPTPSVIKPEVRIFSSATDREPVQPSLTTPPLAPVLANTTSTDSLSRTRNLGAQAGDAAEAPETVVVTIGRVDVRAIFAPPQAAPRATRTQPQPLSLDEYLKQRSEGRR